jgi:DNA repair photolyase
VESIEPLGFDLPMFDITTGTGDFIADGVVSHNCFARPTHAFLDMNAGSDFEKKIVVKVNAPEVLRRQLAAKRWKGEGIAMGTNTDPYQRAEGRYRLMPGIVRALTDYRNPFSILTKGTLILRDLDLLRDAARVTDVSTAFSIGTLDEDAWRASEPGTPHPRKRIEAVRTLNEAGIPCGVLMAPILPGITDDPRQLREVVAAAIDAGATTSRRSCYTCVPACARSSSRGSPRPTPTWSSATSSSTASPTPPPPNATRSAAEYRV